MLFSRGAANARVFADDHCDDGAARSYIIHARTDRIGQEQFSSNWFLSWQLDSGFSQATDDANINTVTPNPTVIATRAHSAESVRRPNGTGMLTIQTGGTVANSFGTVGNLPGAQGTVTVTGAGSTWTNTGGLVVGGLGTGTLTIQNGGTVNSGGGSVGQSAGSNGTVTVTGPGSSWINGPSGGLNIGSFGTGALTIANGGMVINITAFAANIGNSAGSQGTVTVTGRAPPGATFGGEHWQRGQRHAHDADGGTVRAAALFS